MSYKNDMAVFSFKASKSSTGYDLPVLYYGRKYKVSVNGKIAEYSKSQRGTMQIALKKGTNRIKIRILKAKRLICLEVLSLMGWLALIVYISFVKISKKRK